MPRDYHCLHTNIPEMLVKSTNLSYVCTMVNYLAGSRRLITYRRIPDFQVDISLLALRKEQPKTNGQTADDLNAFRRAYFRGFKAESRTQDIPPN